MSNGHYTFTTKSELVRGSVVEGFDYVIRNPTSLI